MPLQLEANTQAVLETLHAQAAARNMDLADYLRLYAEAGEVLAANDRLSTEDFEQLLDELAADPAALPSLPADFGPQDIYVDHD